MWKFILIFVFSVIHVVLSKPASEEQQALTHGPGKRHSSEQGQSAEQGPKPEKGKSHEQENYLEQDMSEDGGSTGARLGLWENGIVPYLIDELSYDAELRGRLQSFFHEFERLTGIHLEQLTRTPQQQSEDPRWLIIVNRRGLLHCVQRDPIGKTGPQKVVIGYDCMDDKNLLAMLLEVLGIPPQHRAPDRDQYVRIHLDNVIEDKLEYFKKFSEDEWPLKRMEYDLGSVGHWSSHAYTKNGQVTIEKLNTTGPDIGNAVGLSYGDLSKIRFLYGSLIDRRDNYLKTCRILYSKGQKFKFNRLSQPNMTSESDDDNNKSKSDDDHDNSQCDENKKSKTDNGHDKSESDGEDEKSKNDDDNNKSDNDHDNSHGDEHKKSKTDNDRGDSESDGEEEKTKNNDGNDNSDSDEHERS